MKKTIIKITFHIKKWDIYDHKSISGNYWIYLKLIRTGTIIHEEK